MERETKTVTTPEGKELVVKTYLTAKERNSYLEELAKNGIRSNADQNDPSTVFATIKSAKKLIEVAVASYDGNKDNIADRLEEAKSSEYDFVIKTAAEIATGNFQQAK